MLRKTVTDPYSGDWKSSVAVGCESGTGNRQFIDSCEATLYWMVKSPISRKRSKLQSYMRSIDWCYFHDLE